MRPEEEEMEEYPLAFVISWSPISEQLLINDSALSGSAKCVFKGWLSWSRQVKSVV